MNDSYDADVSAVVAPPTGGLAGPVSGHRGGQGQHARPGVVQGSSTGHDLLHCRIYLHNEQSSLYFSHINLHSK